MSRGRWVAAAAVIVVAVFLYGQWGRRRAAESEGRWKAIAVRLQSDSAALAGRVAVTDTLFRRDTIRLRTVLNRYVTRRDSLKVTDTLLVREFIAVSDTAIRACVAAVESCTARVAQRDTLLSIAGRQRGADAALHRAQLARQNPRVLPYAEALVNPLDPATFVARGGIELRVFGPLRLTGAAQYHTTIYHPFALLVGARVTF